MSEELQNNVISSEFFENSDRIERERMYDFTVALNALLKSLRLYGAGNDTVEKNTEKMSETIKFFFATDPFFEFTFNGNDFMLNDVRVKRKKGDRKSVV